MASRSALLKPLSLKAIRALFAPGDVVTVTNHYITRADHPCYGTQQRIIAKVSSSHLHFTESGHVPWPKATQIALYGDAVKFYGGGLGQGPTDLFLTIAHAAGAVDDTAAEAVRRVDAQFEADEDPIDDETGQRLR